MEDRVVGVENEYAFLAEGPEGLAKVLEGSAPRFGHYAHTGTQYRLWLPCGGCLYMDLAKLEWASPECRRIRDVVLYNKAGESIVNAVMRGKEGERLFRFFKTNVSVSEPDAHEQRTYVTLGSHESYLTRNLPQPDSSMLEYYPLLPFLATRQVYGGSGWWEDGAGDKFWRSQRAYFTRSVVCNITTSNRGLLNNRTEPHTTRPDLGRLHLIMGDANMLEYGMFLKIGATMLMIAMLEKSALPRWRISLSQDMPDSGPVKAFQGVARAADLKEKSLFLRNEGETNVQRMSPLDIQRVCCDAARRYVNTARFASEELEHEMLETCRMWSETLDALERDDANFLTGRIDWYTKARIASNRVAKAGTIDTQSQNAIRDDVNILYHATGEDSLYQRLAERGVARRIVTDEEIAYAAQNPLPLDASRGTRSCIRAYAVSEALRPDAVSNVQKCKPDWGYIGYELPKYDTSDGVPSTHQVKFTMEDPLTYEPGPFKDFLEHSVRHAP